MIAEKDARARTTGTGTDNHWVVIKSDTNHGTEARKLELMQAIAAMAISREQDTTQRKSKTQATKEKKV
jgi:hypothetical protein